MKIDLSKEVPFNHWESRMIPAAMYDLAQTDPAMWKKVRDTNSADAAFSQALAWGEGQQVLTKRMGGGVGIPSGEIDLVLDNVSQLITSPPESLKDLGVQLGKAGIGIVTDALSSIPIVGAIASAIGGVVRLLIDLATAEPEVREETLAPLQEYSETSDQWIVNKYVLVQSAKNDWSVLFLPQHVGSWIGEDRENGWVFRPRDDGATAAVGFMPGTQRVTGTIQTYFIYKSQRVAKDPDLAVNLADGQDTGSFFPGVAQLMTALSGNAQRPATWLWCVDPDAIETAWTDHILGAREFAIELWNGKKGALSGTKLGDLNDEQRQAVARAFWAQFLVSSIDGTIGGFGTYAWTPQSKIANVLDEMIIPWCKTVRKRQKHYLRTTAVAYASSKSEVFSRNMALRTEMEEMRKKLLEHPARRDVVLADVVDQGYRLALQNSLVGTTLAAPHVEIVEAIAPELPNAEPKRVAGGAPFVPGKRDGKRKLGSWRVGDDEDDDLGGVIMAGMALGLAGLGARALLKRRRR